MLDPVLAPSGLHDPEDAEVIGQLGPWVVHRLSVHDLRLYYTLRRGMLSLLLTLDGGWSIVTPSRLTLAQWELRRPDGAVFRAASLEALQAHAVGVRLPQTCCAARVVDLGVTSLARRALLFGRVGEPGVPFPIA